MEKFELLGGYCGDQFKYFWSTKNHDGIVHPWTELDHHEKYNGLYIYPDNKLEIVEPEFDELVFPEPISETYPFFKKK